MCTYINNRADVVLKDTELSGYVSYTPRPHTLSQYKQFYQQYKRFNIRRVPREFVSVMQFCVLNFFPRAQNFVLGIYLFIYFRYHLFNCE